MGIQGLNLRRLHRNTITAAMLLYYITDRKSLAGTDAQQRNQMLMRIGEATQAGVDWFSSAKKIWRPATWNGWRGMRCESFEITLRPPNS